jgi:succinyl-diaminopimelate desuccinylase
MSGARTALEARLQHDRDEIIAFVRTLVQIPSENPPGDTTAVFDVVTRWLESRGLDYRIVAPQPHMPNLLASFEGGNPGRHLVLNGHLDVFPAGDPARWSDPPFSGVIRDGKLFGRGVADMKTGTAASILTYAYLSEYRQELAGTLTLTVVSDEETGGRWGTQYLLEHHPDALGDSVLNGEPSTPQLVRFGEKGTVWLALRVTTPGGHGGYPFASRNAVSQSARLILGLEQLAALAVDAPPEVDETIEVARHVFDARLGRGATDAVKRVTVNIGRIEGGTKVNLIAADCRFEVDVRCPIGCPTEWILQRVDEILRRYSGVSYEVLNRCEPNYHDPGAELMTIVQRNAEQVYGVRPLPAVSLGGTDGRLWRLRGIPAIVYGPTPHNMGAADEYVTIEDVLGTVRVHVLSAFDYLTRHPDAGDQRAGASTQTAGGGTSDATSR